MKKRLLLIILISTSISCMAEPKKDLATSDKEFKIFARENLISTVKSYCVDEWTAESRRNVLSKFASVAEMCECVQSEMNFTVSDELAERLLFLQVANQEGAPNKYASAEENLRTTKDWYDRYSAADRNCKDRFIRRRN